ncbi:MAG: glycosyltransferase family 2 protein [Flavobacteriales bacterium]|nr:glycosyltransferase family 2 protein [Flavobacteriales bacterium]
MTIIDVVIPAYNEEESVPLVVRDIPTFVRNIVVVNNNSTDNTAVNAKLAGAIVVDQPLQGYGNACLKGIEFLKDLDINPDVIVFLDADYSDHPEELSIVIKPIVEDGIDMVIGSRALGNREDGSMMPQQRFGNWLATRLIRLFYRQKFTDLGPFRALKFDKLLELNMQDKTYGWTVEMQVKAVKQKMSFCEVPVSYRKRIGVSKITGTIKGTFLAGYKIITTIIKYSFK